MSNYKEIVHWVTTRKYCIPDSVEHLQVWIHSSFYGVYMSSTSSRQMQFQYREGDRHDVPFLAKKLLTIDSCNSSLKSVSTVS